MRKPEYATQKIVICSADYLRSNSILALETSIDEMNFNVSINITQFKRFYI